MTESNKYLKTVEWSEEDNGYLGSIPVWLGSCCHVDDEETVYRELCQILDEWIDIFKQNGKELPPARV